MTYLLARNPSKYDRTSVEALMAYFGDRPACDVRTADVQRAARMLYPRVQPQTWNRTVVAPAAAVLHLASDSFDDVPYRPLNRFREPQPRRPRLTEAQISQVIASADAELAALLLVLACHGLRIGEALALTWAEHIDLRNQRLNVWIPKVRAWKEIPMSGPVFESLAAMPDKHGKVFRWHTRWGVYRQLRKVSAACGFHITPHMFRRSFATELNKRGATAIDIRDASTWLSVRSVERYIATDEAHVRDVLGRLHYGQKRGDSAQDADSA